MGILSDRRGDREQWSSLESSSDYINSNSNPRRNLRSGNERKYNNRNRNKFIRLLRLLTAQQLYNSGSSRRVSIYPELSRARHDQPDNNSKSHHHRKRHRHNKYVYAISTLVLSLAQPAAVLAEGVGGVSATANPIANSSGSVTNQAIQVLQGPYVTNTYGGGVSCQGTTLNMTPYVQFADSRKDPWEDFYNEPQYNLSDNSGRTVQQQVTVKNYPWEDWYDDRTYTNASGNTVRWFEDGDDITIMQDVQVGDGVPDAVQDGNLAPTWYKPVRTDMRANQSFNLGLSATLSIPLNRGMQRKCAEAAQAQINMQTQLTANKRLDFEIARLKNCGELKKAGIFFHPASPYASICADVVVTNPGGKITPHSHTLPQPNFEDSSSDSSQTSTSLSQPSSQPSSSSDDSSQTGSEGDLSSNDTHSSSSLPQSDDKGFFRGLRLPWSSPVSQQVSPPSAADQLGVWQVGHSTQQQTQSQQSSSQPAD